MKVWELKITGRDACEDNYVQTLIYSSEEKALYAFQAWLADQTPDDIPIPNMKALSRIDLEGAAKNYFDTYEPDCGPDGWELQEIEVDPPFDPDSFPG